MTLRAQNLAVSDLLLQEVAGLAEDQPKLSQINFFAGPCKLANKDVSETELPRAGRLLVTLSEDGFLDVLPRTSTNQSWIISVQSVVGWEAIAERVTCPPIANAQTARSQLRRSRWSRFAWSLFLKYVRARRLIMWRLDGDEICFGDFMIDPDALEKLLAHECEGQGAWFSVSAAARKLGVKEEVCYHLVRKQLLASETGTLRDRECRVVHISAIETFRSKFISLVDAAKERYTTSRALLAVIRTRGIEPVCGSDIDGCRQYFLYLSDWRRGT